MLLGSERVWIDLSACIHTELWGDAQVSSRTYENCSYNAAAGSYPSNVDSDRISVNTRSESPDPFDTSRVYGK
jgi:hypothetical protein